MYFVEKTKGTNFLKDFDYFLFIPVLLLSGIGILVLSSAVRTMPGGSGLLLKQVICLVIGIIISLTVCAIDYKDFKFLGFILYAISVVLLVIVLFKGTGKEEWGSNSWLSLPVIGGFQPSEFAKIAIITVISIFLERMKEGHNIKENTLKLIMYSAVPILLVLAQPDWGTALVFIFAIALMMFVYGIKYRYIFITIGTSMVMLPFMWFFVMKEHQKWRIKTFLNPSLDPLGRGWQVVRSKLAVGSGQLFGKQLYKGIQTQNGGVPVKESDFIFSVIGEELGFIGAVAVLVIIFLILMRCLYIARHSRDLYGSFLAVGLTAMMGFHFIENIGMCIGVLPVTGIPLPFISAGGSALVTNYFAIGLILSISMRRKKTLFGSP